MYEQQAALLRRWIEVADEAAAALGPDRPAGRRLADTRDFFAFMHAELPGLIQRWRDGLRRAPRSSPRRRVTCSASRCSR